MSALFMPIIFFCTVGSVELPAVCAFKSLPAVSNPRYCEQVVEQVKSRLEPHLSEFKFIAVSCVIVEKAREV